MSEDERPEEERGQDELIAAFGTSRRNGTNPLAAKRLQLHPPKEQQPASGSDPMAKDSNMAFSQSCWRATAVLCDHCHVGRVKMHAGEIATGSRLVRRLLRHQFPQWADLPIEMVPSYGTDHDIYRLGDQLCARMPRTGWAAGQAEREGIWLPRLAPHLPLALPVQVALGQPADGYPFTWSVYQWLPGDNANGTISDLRQAAADLAGFVTAMRRIDTTGDWGGLNAGDPACDLQPAWNIFAGPSRKLFLSELGAGDDACLRGRGWTLYQAITGLYYWDTNPGMIRQASHALAQVLAGT
jgi:aminoglycoside phosphotransferase (APT) family kinase protein